MQTLKEQITELHRSRTRIEILEEKRLQLVLLAIANNIRILLNAGDSRELRQYLLGENNDTTNTQGAKDAPISR